VVFTQGFRCKNFYERKEYDAQKEGEKTIKIQNITDITKIY